MDDQLAGFPAGLQASLTPGAQVSRAGRAWRLSIPAGPASAYRLAQLDDYSGLPRKSFRWQVGSRLSLAARACQPDLPGTWGFGLWNDPFSMGILSRVGGSRSRVRLRLPALPDTAWFFYASPPSYLSLRDDLPARGWLAAAFSSRQIPSLALLPAILGAPLLFFPPGVRLVRRSLRALVQQDAALLDHDPVDWHRYEITWDPGCLRYLVDGQEMLRTGITSRVRLGLVIWIDNQYMAATPQGQLKYGMLPTSEPAWIEISDLQVQRA